MKIYAIIIIIANRILTTVAHTYVINLRTLTGGLWHRPNRPWPSAPLIWGPRA